MKKHTRPTFACIIGTRPEAIKMAPIFLHLAQETWCSVILINTAQHRDLLDDVFQVFNITPDVHLDTMIEHQSLGMLTSRLCERLDKFFTNATLDAVLAVGDTTSVLAAALMSFYHQIPFAHVEAGLRTGQAFSPFPEEGNRKLIASLAAMHFAPTITEKKNLLRENILPSCIKVTGNPVVDALQSILHTVPQVNIEFDFQDLVVLTVHRRENLGTRLNNICEAVLELALEFETVTFALPLHPNPAVQSQLTSRLANQPRIRLLPPQDYGSFIHLMNHALFIMSDSGGVQEEAPALNKPILILRETTERCAITDEGLGLLVGTEKNDIVHAAQKLLNSKSALHAMQKGVSPYGDGKAAMRIVTELKNWMQAPLNPTLDLHKEDNATKIVS